MTENKITQGNIRKEIFFFFIPIVISAFFQHFYTIVDGIIVGQCLGDQAFAAVGGSAAKLITMLINFFVGMSAGITVYTSQFFGRADLNSVKKIIYNGFVSFVVFALLLASIGLFLSVNYLKLMNTPENTMNYSIVYLNTFLVGLIFCVLYNLFSGIFRAIGDAKTPLYVLIFCSILNILFDLLFVAVFPWGVFGVAFATLLSQGISAIILGGILYKKFKQEKIAYALDREMIKGIFKLGIPTGIQSIMYSLSNMLVQSTINTFGAVTVTAWSAYLKIDGIVDVFSTALGSTVVTFVGQNLGAAKIERVKKAVNNTIFISYSIIFVVVVGLFAFRFPMLRMFSDNNEVVQLASSFFYVVMPMYLLGIPNSICSQAVRGLGKSFKPMIMSLVGVVGLRFFWVLVIFPADPTIHFLATCYPVSGVIMSIVFVCYYKYELQKTTKSMGNYSGILLHSKLQFNR